MENLSVSPFGISSIYTYFGDSVFDLGFMGDVLWSSFLTRFKDP